MEKFNQIDSYISKFKNGEERYNKSALVNKVINSLASGSNPYEIIDQLCQMNDDINDAFVDYMTKNPIQHNNLNIDKSNIHL